MGRKKTKSRALGPLILLATQYLTRIMGPLISIILVRYLGTEEYGLYASAIAVTSFLLFLPEFGLQQSILKLTVNGDLKLNNLIKTAFYTSTLYTVFTFFFLFTWLYIFQYDQLIKTLAYILSITFIRTALLKIITTVLQIKREFTKIAGWSVAVNASQWILTVVCITLQSEIITLVFWPQFIAFFITFVMFIIEGRKIKLFNNFNPFKENVSYKVLVKDSLEFGTANSMYQMYHHSDAVIMSATRSPLEVGYYNIAFRVSELINYFATVLFNQVLYPIFFKWSKSDRDKYLFFYKTFNKVMILFGFLAASLIILLSNELIYIIYGAAEEIPVLLLSVMIIAVPLRYLIVSLGAILTTDNLVRERIKIQFKIAILNIGLNAFLVPKYGAIAAAILLIVTDLFLLVGYLLTTNKHVTKNHFGKKIYLQLPIMLTILFSVYYITGFSLKVKVISAITICMLFVIISLLSFEKSELQRIKKILKI